LNYLDLEFADLVKCRVEVVVTGFCGDACVRRVGAVSGRTTRWNNFPYGKWACDGVSADRVTG
jgi:hypothetical protein